MLGLVLRDEDYIYSRRFGYSAQRMSERYPEGAPDSLIATVMLVEEFRVPYIYERIVKKLRKLMAVE